MRQGDGFEFKEELDKDLKERINEIKDKQVLEEVSEPEKVEEIQEEKITYAEDVNEAELIDHMAEVLLSQIQSVEVVVRKGMHM